MAKKNTINNQGISSQKMNIPNTKPQFTSNIKTVNPVSAVKSSSTIPQQKIVNPTYEQIAERAKSIWMNRGCPNGQDEKIWFDAESQLKQELGIY